MAVEVLIVAAIAALVSFALVQYFPSIALTMHWGRKVIWGFFAFLTALAFVSTNVSEFMVVGGIILVFTFLTIFIEGPNESEVW